MFKQLRYFRSVVRLNSFSAAAEENYISQSAISQQLQALEQKIVELQQMQQSLRRLVSQCHGDERPDCPILDELATEKSEKSGKKGCHDGGG